MQAVNIIILLLAFLDCKFAFGTWTEHSFNGAAGEESDTVSAILSETDTLTSITAEPDNDQKSISNVFDDVYSPTDDTVQLYFGSIFPSYNHFYVIRLTIEGTDDHKLFIGCGDVNDSDLFIGKIFEKEVSETSYTVIMKTKMKKSSTESDKVVITTADGEHTCVEGDLSSSRPVVGIQGEFDITVTEFTGVEVESSSNGYSVVDSDKEFRRLGNVVQPTATNQKLTLSVDRTSINPLCLGVILEKHILPVIGTNDQTYILEGVFSDSISIWTHSDNWCGHKHSESKTETMYGRLQHLPENDKARLNVWEGERNVGQRIHLNVESGFEYQIWGIFDSSDPIVQPTRLHDISPRINDNCAKDGLCYFESLSCFMTDNNEETHKAGQCVEKYTETIPSSTPGWNFVRIDERGVFKITKQSSIHKFSIGVIKKPTDDVAYSVDGSFSDGVHAWNLPRILEDYGSETEEDLFVGAGTKDGLYEITFWKSRQTALTFRVGDNYYPAIYAFQHKDDEIKKMVVSATVPNGKPICVDDICHGEGEECRTTKSDRDNDYLGECTTDIVLDPSVVDSIGDLDIGGKKLETLFTVRVGESKVVRVTRSSTSNTATSFYLGIIRSSVIGYLSDSNQFWTKPSNVDGESGVPTDSLFAKLKRNSTFMTLTVWREDGNGLRLKTKPGVYYMPAIWALYQTGDTLTQEVLTKYTEPSDIVDICFKEGKCTKDNTICYLTAKHEREFKVGKCLDRDSADFTALYKDKAFKRIAANTAQTVAAEIESVSELCLAVIKQDSESTTDYTEGYSYNGVRFTSDIYSACRRKHGESSRKRMMISSETTETGQMFTAWREDGTGAVSLTLPKSKGFTLEMWAIHDVDDDVTVTNIVKPRLDGVKDSCVEGSCTTDSNSDDAWCYKSDDKSVGLCIDADTDEIPAGQNMKFTKILDMPAQGQTILKQVVKTPSVQTLCLGPMKQVIEGGDVTIDGRFSDGTDFWTSYKKACPVVVRIPFTSWLYAQLEHTEDYMIYTIWKEGRTGATLKLNKELGYLPSLWALVHNEDMVSVEDVETSVPSSKLVCMKGTCDNKQRCRRIIFDLNTSRMGECVKPSTGAQFSGSNRNGTGVVEKTLKQISEYQKSAGAKEYLLKRGSPFNYTYGLLRTRNYGR